MSVVLNEVRNGFYLDSVALMRLSAELRTRGGIEEAVLMIGTDNNQRLMSEAGLLTDIGRRAGSNDLIIALRANSRADADATLAAAIDALERPQASSNAANAQFATLAAATSHLPAANLALISTPGEFAVREARQALAQGLNVMIFSDNVPIAEEVALKQAAAERDLLVMGPDCGTAFIAGAPLAFANVVPRGDIGIVAASGTGLQEVACLLARNGHGIAHGIGVGGRDLSDEVGGLSTLAALRLLAQDETIAKLVIVGKPPGDETAARITSALAEIDLPVTVCGFARRWPQTPDNVTFTDTLTATVEHLLSRTLPSTAAPNLKRRGGIRGLYTGGTLCTEALSMFAARGIDCRSNLAAHGADAGKAMHSCVDLGADEFTLGKPHPMIEPDVRVAHFRAALNDPSVAIVVLDVVLGYGSHPAPADGLINCLAEADASHRPCIIASVCGTDQDPQSRRAIVEQLRSAGVLVANSNADAVNAALTAFENRP